MPPRRYPETDRPASEASGWPEGSPLGIAAAPAIFFLKRGKLGYHISRPPMSVSELSGSLRGFIREASWIFVSFGSTQGQSLAFLAGLCPFWADAVLRGPM